MKILITGGAGFIGSHLAERLLAQGHSVMVVDDCSTGNTDNLPMYGIPNPKFEYWHGRTQYRGGLVQAVRGCEFVYHLASTVGINRVLENPKACIENNIESLKAVLELGVPGLFTSTSEVYGKTTNELLENSDLVYSSASRWAYATSKLICEWMCQQASGWKAVRLFNVVGPRQSGSYGAVLPRFVKQALHKKPLTVYGDGSQIRTFIDVRDCVEILDKLRNKDFDVVNVGGLHVMEIGELACKVYETLVGEFTHERDILVNWDYDKVYKLGFEECPTRIPSLAKLDSLVPGRRCIALEKTILDVAEYIKAKERTSAEASIPVNV